MNARRTVDVTSGRCLNKYAPGPSAHYCRRCPFFHGSLGSSGPSSDRVSCDIEDDVADSESRVEHPQYRAFYETWSAGGRVVAMPKKRKKK